MLSFLVVTAFVSYSLAYAECPIGTVLKKESANPGPGALRGGDDRKAGIADVADIAGSGGSTAVRSIPSLRCACLMMRWQVRGVICQVVHCVDHASTIRSNHPCDPSGNHYKVPVHRRLGAPDGPVVTGKRLRCLAALRSVLAIPSRRPAPVITKGSPERISRLPGSMAGSTGLYRRRGAGAPGPSATMFAPLTEGTHTFWRSDVVIASSDGTVGLLVGTAPRSTSCTSALECAEALNFQSILVD